MLSGWLEAAAEPSSLLVVWFHKSNSFIDSPVKSDMCRRLEDSGKVDIDEVKLAETQRAMRRKRERKEDKREIQIIKSRMSR